MTTMERVSRHAATRSRAAARRHRLGVRGRLAISDTLAVGLAVTAAYAFRFGPNDAELAVGANAIGYQVVAATMAVAWLAALQLGRTRDPRIVGVAGQESRIVIDWTLRVFGVLAIVAYAVKIDLARSFFVIALTAGLALLLTERWAWRRWLARERRAGRQLRRVLAVGTADGVAALRDRLERSPQAGYRLAGDCDPMAFADDGAAAPDGTLASERTGGAEEPNVVAAIMLRAKEFDVQAVAFLASEQIEPCTRRRIDWALRENGIDVIHVPPLDATAGAKLWTEMIGGLPLIHVLEPSRTLRGALKSAFDAIVAVVALLVSLLPGLVIAAAIKLTSPGPVFYVQRRIGRNGASFPMIKFRTMRVGAHEEVDELRDLDDGNGMLFKVRDDPRVTSVGRVLRRTSLDELPQFLNVLAGQMSVVGPRPPLPEEVARYSDEALRRLVIKPGITGLWQISGRSDLSWDESVRLDLMYVDSWSVLKDVGICCRTVRAMVDGEGAY